MKPKMNRTLFLLVFASRLLVDVKGEDTDELKWEQCSAGCVCSKTAKNLTAAMCSWSPVLLNRENCSDNIDVPTRAVILYLTESNLTGVPTCLFSKTTNLTKLDLSDNKIQAVPDGAFKGLVHLQELSLAHNELEVITENSFAGLDQLRHLDLSYNRLETWLGDTSVQLPSLLSLDLTGNGFRVSNDRMLRFPNLVWLDGISWSNECKECLLLKTAEFEEEEICYVTLEDYAFSDELEYGLSLSLVKLGFSPQCFCDEDRESCADLEVNKPYNVGLNELPRQLFYAEYFFGPVAIALNLVTFTTIASSNRLRKSPSFLAVGSVSLCDIIMGVYSTLIARYTVYEFIVNEESYPGMDTFVNSYCTAMGVMFTTAQITAVLSSFLMTLERYLAIVYCMNPAVRIRRKAAIACLSSFWLVAIAYSLLPVFRVGGLRYHGEFTCMLPFVNSEDITKPSTVCLAVAVFLVVLYITSLALYVPIFCYVKKAGENAGVQRKAALAKKMAVMIVTNFLFFIVPMTCTLLFVYLYIELMEAFNVDSLAKLKVYFILLSWLPVVCLTINSCLNPFLCAFRHPRFKEELRVLIGRFAKLFKKESNQDSQDKQITHSFNDLTLALENQAIQLSNYQTISTQ